MERGRSFSGGWNHKDRTRSPRIATVKPVSKSFSEDDLMKAVTGGGENGEHPISPRVFSRLKVQDLAALKKDNLISELEKCLGELEEEHDTTNKMAEVYDKMENERNQLLEELDVAFQDLQEYMHRHNKDDNHSSQTERENGRAKQEKEMEEQTSLVETDRDELVRENEYLKAVLSNRTEIQDTQAEEANRTLSERVKELEEKNTELVDEINSLYEDRQTLISSLLHLRSEEVDDVIKRSRSNSLASRGGDSTSGAERLLSLGVSLDEQVDAVFNLEDDALHEQCKKTVSELSTERQELSEAFKRVKKERDTAEKELDQNREDKDKLENLYTEKIKESNDLAEERNKKNLTISELKLEKRTVQRQLDHMRENNRALASKIESVEEENSDLRASLTAIGAQLADDNEQSEQLERITEEFRQFKEEHDQQVVGLQEALTEKEQLVCNLQQNTDQQNTDQQKNNALLEEGNQIQQQQQNTVQDEQHQTRISELQNTIAERESQLTEARAQADTFHQEVSNAKEECDKMAAELHEVKKLMGKLRIECDDNDNIVTSLREEKHDLDNLVASLREEKNSLVQELDDTKNNLVSSLREEKHGLAQQLEDVKNKLRQECNKNRQAAKENSELKQQMLQLTHDVEVSSKQSKNRINTLEIEVTKGMAAKEAVEKMLRRKEKEGKSLKTEIESLHAKIAHKEKEIEAECLNANQDLIQTEMRKYEVLRLDHEKLSQRHRSLETDAKSVVASRDLLTQKVQNLENELSNCRNNFNTLKIENERLTKKIRQSERAVTENKDFQVEIKCLKGVNDALSQRVRLLETEEHHPLVVKIREEERVKYSSLEAKNSTLSTQLETCRVQLNTSAKESEKLQNDFKTLNLGSSAAETETATASVVAAETNNNNAIAILQKELESAKRENAMAENTIDKLNKEVEVLKSGKAKMEQDIKYLFQSRKEEAESVFTTKRTEIEYERDTIKAKYESARVEYDKLNKEREHYIMTINTLREENGKLHEQTRKQRMVTNSTQDLTMQRLRDENAALEKQIETLHDTIAKSDSEKKDLANRLERSDESVTTNIRSLKARKSELQIRVNTLEREKEQLSKQLSGDRSGAIQQHQQQQQQQQQHQQHQQQQTSFSITDSSRMAHLERRESDLQGQLATTLSRVAELEADNGDFRKKLEESENLIHDLQQALSKANNLAMQKSVEATKIRRHLEMKSDRLVQENTDLKRKLYFAGKSDGEISPTSLFPTKTMTNSHQQHQQQSSLLQAPGGDRTNGFKLRKISMPASVYNRDKARISAISAIKDASAVRSFEYPLLNDTVDAGKRRLNSASNNSASSSQVELDLSQQLRELLDLTNDLTKTHDNKGVANTGSLSATDDDEAFAPPVPPPPANYETMDRKKSSVNEPNIITTKIDNNVDDDEKQEDWV